MKSQKFIGLSTFRNKYSKLKLSEKFLLHILSLLLIGILISLFIIWNKGMVISSPRTGGTINEGVIGTPRFINPMFAERDVDRDLTSLIYSGLLRRTSKGNLIPDLAKEYEVSEDGTKYTFTLKENLSFHDGRPLTADDVVFTIESIQNGYTKSIEQRNWVDVFVEKINDDTIQFILPDAYSPFVQNLTIGILPKHVWSRTSPEDMLFDNSNLDPIGSGPFMLKSIKKSSSKDTELYSLVLFEDFSLGQPYLEKINFYFYEDQEAVFDAYERGEIDSTIFNVDSNKSNSITRSENIALFLNQGKAPILAKDYIREALNIAINKDDLVSEIFNGNAEPLSGPIPRQISPIQYIDEVGGGDEGGDEEVSSILEDAGWEMNELGLYEYDGETIQFTISTNDKETFLKTGTYIETNLRELGFDATLEVYEENDLIQKVIRPRSFQVLLFGTVINQGLDMYGFWHSSQRNDPGVNITQYTNIDVDSLVSKLRTEQDEDNRTELYTKFEAEIRKDIPAVFLYARKFNYTSPPDLIINTPLSAVYSSERFSMVHTWHKEIDEVWSIFKK